MIFSTNEREFLRLATMSNPDWGELRRLGVESMSWGRLRHMAMLHQLDGLIAWRCIDPEVDGIVPEIFRQDCMKYLTYLEETNSVWVQSTRLFIDLLTKMDIRYMVTGAPAIYPSYGTTCWPRVFNHLDVLIHPDDVKKATELMVTLDWEPPDTSFSDLPGKVMLSGIRINVRMLPLKSGVDHGCTPWNETSVEAAVKSTLLGDIEAMVPRSSDHFASRARSLLLSFAWVPERLTVNKLAEIWHLQRDKDFDWNGMWDAGWSSFDASDNSSSTAALDRTTAELTSVLNVPTEKLVGKESGFSHARYIAWAILQVSRVYDIPVESVERSMKVLSEGPVLFLTLDPNDEPAEWFPTPRRLVCMFGKDVTTEDLLFNQIEPASVQSRLSSGLWREAP